SKSTNQEKGTTTLQSGRLWDSGTHELLIDRGQLLIEPKATSSFKTKIFPEEGTYVIDDYGTRLRISKKKNDEHFVLNKKANYACLDAQKVSWPLQLRIAQNADRFVPFGMRHSKLVSDFLTDKKKSIFEKRRQLVLTMASASDTILWVVNERIDDRFSLSADTTDVIEIVLLAEDQQAYQCQ
ncbi:MAG: tRNA lysidine(34) synthetase TilS, partial [Prevotella sp.]|nr:tRNA lysidine(34) synthetase TilS [Prevotella sp.]